MGSQEACGLKLVSENSLQIEIGSSGSVYFSTPTLVHRQTEQSTREPVMRFRHPFY